MKYDQTDLPTGYDRARDHGPAVVDLWMDVLQRHAGSQRQRIVDLGCGTGRFSGGLARRFDAMVIGIDPSSKMLQQAHAKVLPNVECVRAAAEALPLRAASVDMVFMSMSYHHFDDPVGALRECARVLRKRGLVVLRTGTRERVPDYPCTPFFPEARPIHDEVLPDIPTIVAACDEAGLSLIASEIVPQTIAPDWDAYADKLAAGGDSVLARLTPGEMAEGLERIRRHARSVGVEPIVEPIDLLVFEPRRG